MGHYQARGSATLEGFFIRQERLGSAIAPAKKPPVFRIYISMNFYGGFFARGFSE